MLLDFFKDVNRLLSAIAKHISSEKENAKQ